MDLLETEGLRVGELFELYALRMKQVARRSEKSMQLSEREDLWRQCIRLRLSLRIGDGIYDLTIGQTKKKVQEVEDALETCYKNANPDD